MRCVLVQPDGTAACVAAAQQEAHAVLGGAVTLVGAVDELGVFAVALRDAAALPAHAWCTDPARFDLPVRGPVLFVATDEAGEEADVDEARLRGALGACRIGSSGNPSVDHT